jgi:hypothetical protein
MMRPARPGRRARRGMKMKDVAAFAVGVAGGAAAVVALHKVGVGPKTASVVVGVGGAITASVLRDAAKAAAAGAGVAGGSLLVHELLGGMQIKKPDDKKRDDAKADAKAEPATPRNVAISDQMRAELAAAMRAVNYRPAA